MTKSFACRDDSEFPDCPVVAQGDSDDEVIRRTLEHGRQAHGLTEGQLQDPAVARGIRGYIRDV